MKRKIYLALPSKFPIFHEPILKRLVDYMHSKPELNLLVDFHWFDESRSKDEDFFDKDIQMIDKADFIVAEISYPSSGVGFQIAYALSKKKRVLALYKDRLNDNVSKFLTSISQHLMTIERYDESRLLSVLDRYFSLTKPFKLYKFNFIISERIKDYLNWKAKDKHKSISEYLREQVEKKIIDQDKNYQKYLLNKKETLSISP